MTRASGWAIDNIVVRFGGWLGKQIMGVVDGWLQRSVLLVATATIVGAYAFGMALILVANLAARAGAFVAYAISFCQLACAYYLHRFAIILGTSARKMGECVRFREIYDKYWY